MSWLLLEGEAVEQQASAGGNQWLLLIFYILVIGGVFYFMMYRPQKKKQKAEEKLKNSLQIGDEIITIGGFYGKIISLKEFCEANIILAYYHINDEINTVPIIEHALREGKRVALPISSTVDYTLTFRLISSLDELKNGAYSIPEPTEDAEIFNNETKALCIVPGLSFDRSGNRLGYGKGFYDRFLSEFNGTTVGLCYSEFLLDKLPTDKNDRTVDIVVSDTEEVYL